MLAERDQRYLDERWPNHEVLEDGGQIAVVLQGFRFPDGFAPRRADVLLRLPFGFPDSRPDMFWVEPEVLLYGAPPAASEQREVYLGRTWQRFSRHLQEGQWRPGTDGVQSYVTLLRLMLRREAAGSGAVTA